MSLADIPVPQPEVGQLYRHKRTGRQYRILTTGIEAAGHLRQLYPTGYLHLYICVTTGKLFARLTHEWEVESTAFDLLADTS